MISNAFQFVRDGQSEGLCSLVNSENVNVTNEYGQNLLHEAIAYGNVAVVNKLIELGIDVNHQDDKGQTPLHYTAQHKMKDVAEIILMNKGDVLVTDKFGNQALWTAVFNARGDYDIVSLLLKYNSLPEHKNNSGRSPLDFARQIKDTDLISILDVKV
ncbi:ankyrin repeat domain-containing protein [Pectobacterium carotovorum]|uniref:ankyrin repeat domain-containing protein n=1 Tax=Pectobacterium carotovorum TaxID=554 RepID=UPI0029DA9196|nr:ankyrin repeat domain-containing protein [Pectobacterium carotovorum]MDX6917661.1 ankyrin repeat domain-containing protein [Pectobacterium carotovorum]